MGSKHTPGPWYAYSPLARGIHAGHAYAVANSEPCGIVEDEDGSWVPDFPNWNAESRIICKTTDDEMSRNNARLIAAAPDLLAACVDARNSLCQIPLGTPGVDRLHGVLVAAIAKAEGGAA